MNAADNFDKITHVLKGDNNIVFALVFGSQANRQANQLSDVDIGIFTTDDIPILRLGRIVSALEKIGKKEVDLVVLNDLYKRKPNFAILFHRLNFYLQRMKIYLWISKRMFSFITWMPNH